MFPLQAHQIFCMSIFIISTSAIWQTSLIFKKKHIYKLKLDRQVSRDHLTKKNYPGKRPQTVFKGPFMKLFKDAGFTKLLLLNVSCQTYPPPKLQTPLFFSTAKIEIGRCREAADLCMQKRITWRHAGAWQHVQLA